MWEVRMSPQGFGVTGNPGYIILPSWMQAQTFWLLETTMKTLCSLSAVRGHLFVSSHSQPPKPGPPQWALVCVDGNSCRKEVRYVGSVAWLDGRTVTSRHVPLGPPERVERIAAAVFGLGKASGPSLGCELSEV